MCSSDLNTFDEAPILSSEEPGDPVKLSPSFPTPLGGASVIRTTIFAVPQDHYKFSTSVMAGVCASSPSPPQDATSLSKSPVIQPVGVTPRHKSLILKWASLGDCGNPMVPLSCTRQKQRLSSRYVECLVWLIEGKILLHLSIRGLCQA